MKAMNRLLFVIVLIYLVITIILLSGKSKVFMKQFFDSGKSGQATQQQIEEASIYTTTSDKSQNTSGLSSHIYQDSDGDGVSDELDREPFERKRY
jgi:flagellar basal body-associated protein FliL